MLINQCFKKPIHTLLLLLALLLNTMLQAQSLIVIPPAQPVAAGDEVKLTVYIQADQQSGVVSVIPDQLEVRLMDTASDYSSIVWATKSPVSVGSEPLPEGVVQAHYRLLLPITASAGTLKLQVVSYDSPPAYMLAYQQAPQPEQRAVQLLTTDESKDDDLTRNDFLGNIYAYQPTYFTVGVDPTDAKLQLSFKYRFINERSDLAEDYDWLRGLFFGYTQLSLWDLSAESLPFEDTNFLPELFYQFNDVNLPILNAASRADLQLGLQHESNGRDGDDSRSLNIAYIEPALHFDFPGDYQLSLSPRVWAYFGGKSGNEDIQDFRGNASLTATFGRRDGFQLEAYLRGNPGTGQGSFQLDFTYPLTKLTNKTLGLYLHTQLFSGFGESLLDFNQRDTRFRVGLGLVR